MLAGAGSSEDAQREIEAGPTCGGADERFMTRIPVQIVIDEKALERHQRDEYVVLRNDGGGGYEEPVFVDTSEVVDRPPLR
jgi:hypothetical protein